MITGSAEFANRLSTFLKVYGDNRTGPFMVAPELKGAIQELQAWIENSPAVAGSDTLKVRISVGQGGWTKTPWIALLDRRETNSTQRGIYIVFLVSEDLSVTYLTLNQGMTELVSAHGQRGAVEKMIATAQATRPKIRDLEAEGFALDNEIDLRSNTSAAKNYEKGAIAHVALDSDRLPDDARINDFLEALVAAYDRIITDIDRVDENEIHPAPTPRKQVTDAPAYTIDDALEGLFLDRSEFERYLDIWEAKKNLILQGAPGVGKSFIARRLAYTLIGAKDPKRVQMVQFHQSYSYEDFVQGYRPNGAQGFDLQNGVFVEFREQAVADQDSAYVLIIDEINRGNLSKIFGELMLLIEPDKRGPDWSTRMAYAKPFDPDFFVPPNLYLLGLMNTADRSLSLVDYALRRRFAFVSMAPMFESPGFRQHLEALGVPTNIVSQIVGRMGALNHAIEADRTNLGPGFRIGHSFFTSTKTIDDPERWYRRVVTTEIYPLLEEYWFDAPEKADQWRDRLLE